GMVLDDAAFGDDALAVSVDNQPQRLGAIRGQTRLHQQFNPADIGDSVLVLNPKPERFPGLPELPGRIRGGFGPLSDDGKGRRLGKFFFNKKFPSKFLLNYGDFAPPPRPATNGHYGFFK